MTAIGLPEFLAGAILVALTAYVLLAGADFGGGVWDLFASGPRRERQRELIAHAIAPVWEANHVWLILVLVLLFTCFPPAFSRLSIVLHLPLTLMLVGIVLRGAAFIFRSYGADNQVAQQHWGRTFAIASLLTPVLLGVSVGAIASGNVELPHEGDFLRDYVHPWATLFGLSVGLLALMLFAFLASVYLTVEAREADLREDFRRRALAAGLAVFLAAGTTLALAWRDAPLVWHGLVLAPRAVPLHLATAASATLALGALYIRRFRVARIAAATQAVFILWGWALAQYPWMLPPTLTIRDAAAPEVTLRLAAGALILGAAVLLPSLAYLFRLFKSRESM